MASATRLPIWIVPAITSSPPTPYTTAVASDASSVTVTSSIREYTDVITPTSRTRAALPANRRDSRSGRPYSLTSSAPATLNRSCISEPSSASNCIEVRRLRCSRRPTIRPGSTNSGTVTSTTRPTSQDR